MKTLSSLSAAEAQSLSGLFFDLDDTVLDEGKLSEQAYGALFSLKNAGLRLVALTGRPAAWAEQIARMWPVEAAIAENGAIAFQRQGRKVCRLDTLPISVRARSCLRLKELVSEARMSFPELVPADDVGGRVSDYTFDIGEHEHASESVIQNARALAHARGARTTRSSVHLHFTFDRMDKATGALSYLKDKGEDTTSARRRFAFIGDSENDAPAFSAFRTSCGVRNLSGSFSLPPQYQTQGRASAGFCEFSHHLIRLRIS